MDDSSFVDPEGYSANSQDNFEEEVTSYGDVEVKVTIEMANGDEYTQRAWLSHMLENGHRGEKNPAVRAAIERIERN
jgi:hypothetical protein